MSSKKVEILAEAAEGLIQVARRESERVNAVTLTFNQLGGHTPQGTERFLKALGFDKVSSINKAGDHLKKEFSTSTTKSGVPEIELSSGGEHVLTQIASDFLHRAGLTRITNNGDMAFRIPFPKGASAYVDEVSSKIIHALDVLGVKDFTVSKSGLTKEDAFKIDSKFDVQNLNDIWQGESRRPRGSKYEITP